MKINYSTKLDTGGEDNHVTIAVDGDITDPGDVEFVLSMVRRLIEYDQQRITRLRAAELARVGLNTLNEAAARSAEEAAESE